MANIPIPRSYPQIVGEMIDDFLSRFGAQGIRTGSPILAFLEVAAQSDARSAQDIFNILDALDINRATGDTLDQIGLSYGVARQQATNATGSVNIFDTSFTKVSGSIWAGQPAPIVGSTTIYVAATTWPTIGQVYLGRNTPNLEGPINFTATLYIAGVYILTLSIPTTRYHSIGESAVLAQGGNRSIPSGTIVATVQGANQQAIQFTVLNSTILFDGETEIDNIPIRAINVGSGSNVGYNTITQFVSPPFTGATSNNPASITNGLDSETDDTYRNRIQMVNDSKARGTATAIQAGVYGVSATDESSVLTSSKVVLQTLYPDTLYIDDGTGYEEKTAGVAIETLVAYANGGETKFQLAYGRPVAKAFVKTSIQAPYAMTDGSTLAVKVGGTLSEHTFSAASFNNIANATAYEVVSSINGDYNLLFAARTADNGTNVSIFAKAETNDDIEVIPYTGIDANTALGFPLGRYDTVRLYKNDVLLYKDGLSAIVDSTPQPLWHGFVSGEILIVTVDGTEAVTYVFTNADFINNNTGYTSVSEGNSLASWATVFNAKITGVTTTVSGSSLILTSNLGANNRAAIVIDQSSTLVQKGMFNSLALTAYGKNKDYVLDRNLGQIELVVPLSAGDTLTAGSLYTRAYEASTAFTSLTPGSGAKIWLAVDGQATIIPVGLNSASVVAVYEDNGTTGAGGTANTLCQWSCTAGTFSNVNVGDYCVVWDPAVFAEFQGILRVSQVDSAGAWVTFDGPDGSVVRNGTTFSGLTPGGVTFVRSNTPIQTLTMSNVAYAPADLATLFNTQLQGATAYVYQNSVLRIATNTYVDGDIAIVSANLAAQVLGFPIGSQTDNQAHIASVISVNSDFTFPAFNWLTETQSNVSVSPVVSTVQSRTAVSFANDEYASLWKRPLPNIIMTPPTNGQVFVSGHFVGDYSHRWDPISNVQTSIFASVAGSPNTISITDSNYLVSGTPHGESRSNLGSTYNLGPNDVLGLVLNNDPLNNSFNVPMYLKCVPDPSVAYGSSIRLKTATGSLLPAVFGTTFNFQNFALLMKSAHLD